MQKEGHKGLTGLGRQKPCKNFGGKRQKILTGAQPNRRERGKFEKVRKSDFEKVQSDFKKKKHDSRVSIDRKTASIDRNRQRL